MSLLGDEHGSYPVWDGDHILFMGDRALHRRLMVDDTPTETLGWFGVPATTTTADGQHIVVARQSRSTSWDLWIHTIDGELKPLVIEPGLQMMSALSPDGKWLVYGSDIGNESEVYVARFPDVRDGMWKVPNDGRSAAESELPYAHRNPQTWSRDGDKLYYWFGDRLMSVTVTIGQTLEFGEPKVLYSHFDVDLLGRNFDVMPDGRILLIKEDPEAVKERRELRVVLNWFQELEAKFESRD